MYAVIQGKVETQEVRNIKYGILKITETKMIPTYFTWGKAVSV
jgi:hypothetical protein